MTKIALADSRTDTTLYLSGSHAQCCAYLVRILVCGIKNTVGRYAATLNLNLVLLSPPTLWFDSKLGMVTHILLGGAGLTANRVTALWVKTPAGIR